MGADYSFELISIETYAPQFIGRNNFFLGSVGQDMWCKKVKKTNFSCSLTKCIWKDASSQKYIVFQALEEALPRLSVRQMYVRMVYFSA